MVSVVLISTALLPGILSAQVNNVQELNEQSYFRAVAEYIISNYGVPSNWGSDSSSVLQILGLAEEDLLRSNELDIDKVSRLNGENAFALSYSNILSAAKLNDVALGISVSQLMDISVSVTSNSTMENVTTYTFKVFVSQDGAPTEASVHCYVVAEDFLSNLNSGTSTGGLSYVEAEIPNDSNGTASLVIFARALHDPRITACQVYSFGHLSPEPLPNYTFLQLSPLNYTLFLSPNYPAVVVKNCYAFSYGYEFNLTSSSNTTYSIPTILDEGPTVLVASGSNDSTFFTEWTTYPQVPLETGPSFQNSECHAFSYVVMVKETLYRLTLRFGGVNR
jgi:hypothetical protein